MPSLALKLLIFIPFLIFAGHDLWLGIQHYRANQPRNGSGRILTGLGLFILGILFPFFIFDAEMPPLLLLSILGLDVILYISGLVLRRPVST